MVSKDARRLIAGLFWRFLWILDMGLTFDMISMIHLIPRTYTLHWVEAHLYFLKRVRQK